ncbi:hypothetical protein MLD38_028836 [Melastoma candidum]|uniref:Uncharacterized protein n=1 Tax=Melastoma candidum TaxID=119954 RepID=A0ACB9N400_9MYRT|nr:hypothetical protein MLD38_028836 [Melastoma candidum]
MELLPILIIIFLPILALLSYAVAAREPSPEYGFKIYPIVGALPEFLLNRHRFLDWMASVLCRTPTYTAVFRRPGKVHGVITANPAVVEYVLKSNFQNYPKGDKFTERLRDFLGDGIFNSDGDLWRIQRKTASYEFSTRSLRHFAMHNVTVEMETRLVPALSRAYESGRAIDIQDALERFAFDNICKLAFGVDPRCLAGDADSESEFMHAFEDAAQISSERFLEAFPFFYKVKRFLNVGSERRLRDSIAKVHAFADEIVRSRLEEKSDRAKEDLLSRFIKASESEGDSSGSPEFLRDIIISFILAGRDTTSSALTYFFWLLSKNHHVEKKILEEICRIRSDTGKGVGDPFELDELRDMQYLQGAISESMRLYPPVPVNTRACTADDVLPDGTRIGKGWFISYDNYAMGRMEGTWGKDCCEYKPERWLTTEEEGGKARVSCRQESPFKYAVFHGGPRLCLGKDLAFIQMKSIAAAVMERFVMEAEEEVEFPQHLLSLTLRMKGGLKVRVSPRNQGTNY